MQYLVTWTIEIEADSPKDAAEQALAIHRNPESIAAVFDVKPQIPHKVDICGNSVWGESIIIDLTDFDESGADVQEQEPDINDKVKCCPDCEKPNQFGELCQSCQRERESQV